MAVYRLTTKGPFTGSLHLNPTHFFVINIDVLTKGITQIDRDTAAQLNQLQSMARDTLNLVQGMIQADIELVSNSVIKVWKQT